MRKLLPLLAIALTSPAFAGPGACVQTLIAIQEVAHGSWLRGVVPARVRGVKGHNDVILVQRKDGSYIVNEGAKFYSLPVTRPLPAKAQLLSAHSTGNSGRSFSLYDTEGGRIVTPQGNEVDLHFFTVKDAHVAVMRGSQDDRAYLASAEESTKSSFTSLDHLEATKKEELAICEKGNEDRVGNLGDAVASILKRPGDESPEDVKAAKKRILKTSIDEIAETRKARTAELAEIASATKKLESKEAALSSSKLTLFDLPASDVSGVLSEVSATFSEKMADDEISDTDRAEIKKECGDDVKLPERKATSSEKIKAGICDSLPAPQKTVCSMLMKP